MVNEQNLAEVRAATQAKKLFEEATGRRVQPREYVYPKDGDFFNVSLENLELITPENPRSVYYDGDKDAKRSLGVEVFE